MSTFTYQITPRAEHLGGGWRLQLLEDAQEVGGSVYPVTEECTRDDAHAEAMDDGEAWLSSRGEGGAADLSEPVARFNSLGIAETWSVTVEAEGLSVLCISDQHYSGLSEPDLDLFAETIRACAQHLAAFIGPADPAGGQSSEQLGAARPAIDVIPWQQRIAESGKRECADLAVECLMAEVADLRIALARQSPAPIPEQVAQAANSQGLTEDQIAAVWNSMPGQPGGFLKSFGYWQFAKAIEREVLATEVAWRDATIVDLSSKLVDAESRLATQSAKQGAQPSAWFGGVIDAGEYTPDTGTMRITVKLPYAGLPERLLTINADVSIAAGKTQAPVEQATGAKEGAALPKPTYELASALNSLRWMLNKSDECDRPNMRATTLLDKHHSKDGKTIRQDLEFLWRYFDPNRPEMTAVLLAGCERIGRASTAGAESGGKGGE